MNFPLSPTFPALTFPLGLPGWLTLRRQATPPAPPHDHAGARRITLTIDQGKPRAAAPQPSPATPIDQAIGRTAQRTAAPAPEHTRRRAERFFDSLPSMLRQGVPAAARCPVVRLHTVVPHPRNADWSVAITDAGMVATVPRGEAIAGDLAVFLPAGTQLPDVLLKQLGCWEPLSGYGTLRGLARNRVPARKVRGTYVHGMLLTGRMFRSGWDDTDSVRITLRDADGSPIGEGNYQAGDCAALFLGCGNADHPVTQF